MRKLLLASVAMLGGVALATGANAQNLLNNTVPAGSTAVATPGFSTDIPGAFGSQTPMASSTMTVRLAGKFIADFGIGSDSGRNPSGTNQKLASYSLYNLIRLYPSFDAVAANGLRYGASAEIRQDSGASAGGGAGSSVSGSGVTRGELYFRREYGYFGADQFGFLRIGAGDQPTSLFITGNFENFDEGGWNGDVAFFTGNTQISYTEPDTGAMYTTNKFVYLSPKFANLVDFGVSFEPSTATVGGEAQACSSGYTTTSYCDATSSSDVAGELKRRRNTFDGVVRLRTAVGPVGMVATVGTIQSGKVDALGTAASAQQYKTLNVIDAGAQVTWGGLAVGAHVDYGDFNESWVLSPKGSHKSTEIVGGASYAIGPVIAGVQLFSFQAPGAWTQANAASVAQTRNQYGIAAGTTVTLAPGAYVYASYLYGHRHQDGYDILNGAVGKTHNNVQAQGVILGTMLRW